MKFLVKVEYGYFDAQDVYHGSIQKVIKVEADDFTQAESPAWDKVKESLGQNKLSHQLLLSITRL